MIDYKGMYNLIKYKGKLREAKDTYYGNWLKYEVSRYGSLNVDDIRYLGKLLGVTFYITVDGGSYNLDRCDFCDIIVSYKELNELTWGYFNLETSYNTTKLIKWHVKNNVDTLQKFEDIMSHPTVHLAYKDK